MPATGDIYVPDNKVHGANMGPTRVLSAPGGSHVGLTNLTNWGDYIVCHKTDLVQTISTLFHKKVNVDVFYVTTAPVIV